jgi:hypothetical protein
LRVQTERLGQGSAAAREGAHVVDARGAAVGEDGVDLGAEELSFFRVLGETKERPGEDSSRRLVPSDEHGHEVVAQLSSSRVFSARIDEEAQQGGVAHAAVIALLQRLGVVFGARGDGVGDQAVQASVDDGKVLGKLALAGDEPAQEGDVPVGDVEGGAVLGLCFVLFCFGGLRGERWGG